MHGSIAGECDTLAFEKQSSSQSQTAGSRATHLSFSPFDSELFLVGQLDGGCRLYRLDRSTPLLSWLDATVSDLKWSPQRPSVFFLLHTNGNLHTFDLNKDDARPVHSCKLERDAKSPISTLPPKLAISLRNNMLAISFHGTVFTRSLSTLNQEEQNSEIKTLRTKLSATSTT